MLAVHRMLLAVPICLSSTVGAASAQPAPESLTGFWTGEVVRDGVPLSIAIGLADPSEALKGAFTAMEYPLDSVSRKGSEPGAQFHWRHPSPGLYEVMIGWMKLRFAQP